MAAGSAREEMLGNIRRALQPEGKPEVPRVRQVPSAPGGLDQLVVEINRECEQNRGDLIKQFESELTKVGGRFHKANSVEAAIAYIEEVASTLQARSIIAWDTGLIDDLDFSSRLEAKGVRFITEASGGQFNQTAAAADIGISGIDYALADTGTLVLLAGKGRARSISLLPPVHVALMRANQIISGLDDLFPLMHYEREIEGGDLESAITLITGPSRTADIELTLVIGVHGPQQLHIVLLES